ncbi:reverse transcriptase domain-containing protein [Tanacetum coccineum]
MHTRSSSNLIVESSTIPKRRNRRRSKQIVEPELRTIVETPVATMADTRTMSELLQAPTEGYGDAIVIPAILAENFELKVGLLQLVTSSQFHGFERDDPHAHIRWFNKITSTLMYKNVPHDAIKLMLFPFSLEGAARIWLEKEPPRSIHTWEDLVSKFVNYFFPPSKTTNLKNDITNFQQKFDKTFSEAWDRFKELLRKCPHHGFSELHQIDTFYNALTQFDQDSLNATAGGNLLNRTPRDALTIIKNKSKVRTSRNKPIVSKVSTTTSSSSPSSNVTALTEIVKELVLMNKANQQASVKAVEDTLWKLEREVELHFDLSFVDALLHIPKFASTFKSLLSNKEKLFELSNTPLNENCSAVLLKKLPEKLRDPRKFLIPCDFLELDECLALADLGASINLMPLSVWKKLSLSELTPTRMTLELANRPVAIPDGVAEDVYVKVGKFYFPTDFVVVDYDVDPQIPLILERPFLRMTRTLIDVYDKVLTLQVNDEAITFKVEHTSRYSRNYYDETDHQVNVIDVTCEEYAQEVLGFLDSLTTCLSSDSIPSGINDADFDLEGDIRLLEKLLNDDPSSPLPLKELNFDELKMIKSSIDDPSELELKDLLSHLEYAFLEDTNKLPVIIAKDLKDNEKARLLKVLKSHKWAIAWKISDIKGIDPRFCTHKILMEDDFKPAVQHQRRVNPKIQEVSPVHCVPKKCGMIVVENKDNELIPTRLVTGWCVCIDYRKLNDATRKDHFPLPFMDQMLERLAGNEYYCFLDGFSRYFQIPIDPQDQEKTTFTCPYGTFAYRRMPFGLCNAPGTFQRCMMAIFHDMIEETMEVFMDDFSVFGDSFSSCLSHLDKMLKRCEDTNLVLNWEKCHFMVKEGIVLGHKISKSGIEVDRAKVDVIAKLPHPTSVKGVQSFLGHAGFYRRFIQDFSKIARPMTHLLEKETPFIFSKECIEAFNILKKKLTEAPILVALDSDLPYEIMCDASDYAVAHYTTTEKELLAVVYAFEKFRPYLVLSKTIVYTDHLAIKYLLANQDTKPRLLRWILLFQEFDVIIHDKKGAENLAADHLSRLENPYQADLEKKEIIKTFPLETLTMITLHGDSSTPWFADIANYHVGNFVVKGMSSQQKKKFFKDVKHYFWDDPYLFTI